MSTQNLTLVFAAQQGLKRVRKVLSNRKGIKRLHMDKQHKTLLGIMIERFDNFGKVNDPATMFGCGFIMTPDEASAFGFKAKDTYVYCVDTAIRSEKIYIHAMCNPDEFIDNKK